MTDGKPDEERERELVKRRAQALNVDLLEDSDLAGLSVEDARALLHGLRASRERLRNILSLNPAVIYTAKAGGDYGATFVSDNIKSQLGFEPSQFTEDSSFWADHIHPDDYPTVMAEMDELLDTGHKVVEYRFQHKDGTYRWMRDEVKVIQDAQGLPVEILGSWLDITDRKKAEEELEESRQRLELVLKGSDVGYWDWDFRTGVATRSARAAELYGCTEDEIEPTFEAWKSAIHPADRQRVLEIFNGHLEGATALYEAEYRLVHKSGEFRWVLARGKVVERDRGGKPLRVTGTLLDITERKQAEQALAESDRRFRELAEFLPQFVFELDREGRFTFLNHHAIQVSGYRPEEFHWDRAALEFVVPEDRARVAAAMSKVYAGQRVTNEEVLIRRENRKTLPVSVYANPIVREGQVVGIRGVGVDISAMKLAEDIMKGDLEEKKLLLREIHHRIKNNLHLISSLVRLQSLYQGDKSVTEIGMELQERIRAMALVHEHLYQSPTMGRVDASGYIRSLVLPLRYYMNPPSQGVELDVDIESVSCELDTAIPLGLMVTELVTNCFKHAFRDGRSGKITVGLRRLGHGELELSVRDTGVGLPRGVKFPASGTTGLDMVDSLARQLHAEVRLYRKDGVEFRFRFKDLKKKGGGGNSC